MFSLRNIALVIMTAAGLLAQRQTASVSGLVTDASNAPIPGATIAVKSSSTGFERTASSNDSGYYAVTALPAGPYSVTVSKQGFSTYGIPELNLQVDQNAAANVHLTVGAVSETISVVGEVSAVDTKNATLEYGDQQPNDDRPAAQRPQCSATSPRDARNAFRVRHI